MPCSLERLYTTLGACDHDATVRHYNGMLIVEQAEAELPLDGDSTDDFVDTPILGDGDGQSPT